MTTSTTLRAACLLAAALAVSGGCASLTSSAAGGSVALPAGGRTQGRLVVPAGAETTIGLANRGPGRVDFDVRMANGVQLQSGALDTATVRFTAAARVVIVVVLDAYPDAPATVTWTVDGAGGARFEWESGRGGAARE
jgi:hypothetical protein